MANRSNNSSSSRSRRSQDREVSIAPMRYKLKKLTQAQTLTQIAMVTQGFYVMSIHSADWVQRDIRSREFSSFGNLPMPKNLNMIVTIIGDENYYLKLTTKNHNMDYICYDSDNNELQFWGDYQCCIRAMNELRYRIEKIQQRIEREHNKQWPVSRYSPSLTESESLCDNNDVLCNNDVLFNNVTETVLDASYSSIAIGQMNKMGFVQGAGLGATGTGRLTPINPVEELGGRIRNNYFGLGFTVPVYVPDNVPDEPVYVPDEPVYVPDEPVYVPDNVSDRVPDVSIGTPVISDAEKYGCKCNGDTGICCMSCWRNADA